MNARHIAMLAMALLAPTMPAVAAHHFLSHLHRSSGRQRRVYTNDIFTIDPGTVEMEFGVNTGSDLTTIPTVLKYEPDTDFFLIHQTEFSFSSDTMTRYLPGEHPVLQFADQQSIAVLRPVFQRQTVSIAIQPQVTFFVRGDEAARWGGALLGGWAKARNSVVGSVTWSATTRASDANPAHEYDYELTYTRGLSKRWSALLDASWSQPARQTQFGYLAEGVLYKISDRLTLDAAIREQDLGTGNMHPHFTGGFVYNFGRIGRRH